MITVLYIWKYRRLLVKQYLTLGINSTTKLQPRELSWVDRLNRFKDFVTFLYIWEYHRL